MEAVSTIYNVDNLGNAVLLVKPCAPVSFIMSHFFESSECENVEVAYDSPRSYQCYGTDKCHKTDNKPDRFNVLPDPLILHILASCQMKDVIQTGVLSKRWRVLWTSAYNLSFTHSPESNRENLSSFVYVLGFLGFYINSESVKKLVIRGYLQQEHEDSDDADDDDADKKLTIMLLHWRLVDVFITKIQFFRIYKL
ncbi:hypothetical protein CQW23_08137 [Capsicum baccatum]|uniref:F-box domain-containing protein n=1 Tax=Capsicum baccatum TaxID=33114 RepID=A0A2G2X845_CAPBA|nr:hypothetical protein CQW23_08137 [Capsicum baccatum]